jgi:hypothetical protein
MNSTAVNHPSGQAISENRRISRLYRYFPVSENRATRTAHETRNGSRWRVNNHGNDGRNEITPRKAGGARPAVQDCRLLCFGNEKVELVMPTTRAPQRQGTGASLTKLNARRGPELWHSSAPTNKAELPKPTGRLLSGKPARLQRNATRSEGVSSYPRQGRRLTPSYKWRPHRRRNGA